MANQVIIKNIDSHYFKKKIFTQLQFNTLLSEIKFNPASCIVHCVRQYCKSHTQSKDSKPVLGTLDLWRKRLCDQAIQKQHHNVKMWIPQSIIYVPCKSNPMTRLTQSRRSCLQKFEIAETQYRVRYTVNYFDLGDASIIVHEKKPKAMSI